MKKTLFLAMVMGGIAAASASTVQLTLPGANDYVWVPGSNASGITTDPTAGVVARLAGVIQAPDKFNTDLTGWFAGTGQGYDSKSTYAADVTVNSETSFTIAKRPALSQEYMMMGVALDGGAESVTLRFNANNTIAYSLWAYDADSGTATELLGYTATTEKAVVTNATTGAVAETADYLFALWGSAPVDGGGGVRVTVSDISLLVEQAGTYYWAPSVASGTGTWAGQSWLEDNAGSTVALPTGTFDVVFDNAAYTDATVTVAGDVVARNMSLKQGSYSFEATGTAGLRVTDTLLVNGASAEFSFDITADNVTVERGALTGKTITVGDSADDVFAMSGGSLSVESIAGSGKVQITGGNVEISNYITATGGTEISGATLVGTTVLDGSKGSPLALGALTVDAVSVHLANATLAEPIVLINGNLGFSGMMILNKGAFSPEQLQVYTAAENSGYLTETDVYTVVTGNLTGLQSDARWISGGKGGELKNDGKVYITHATDTSVYWVRGTTVADAAWEQLLAENATPAVRLDGGTLQVEKEYAASASIGGSGIVELAGSGVLNRSSIAADASAVYLSGNGTYYTEGAVSLHGQGGVLPADSWSGTVNVGDAQDGKPLVLNGLANEKSAIAVGRADVPTIQVQSALNPAGLVSVSFLSLSEGASEIHASAVTVEHLHLGSVDAAASLTVHGVLELSQSTVYLEHPDSTLTAHSLADGTTRLNFVMDSHLLSNATGENVLLTLTDPDAEYADITLTLNGNTANERVAAEGSKHAYSLIWDASQQAVILHALTNPQYVLQKYAGATGNAAVGVQMLNAAFAQNDPQSVAPGSDLARVLDHVDSGALTHEALAAVAGSSAASLGMALSGDVERQLRAIRNRTTTMGVNLNHAHPDMPYYNAWVNAEGDFAELDGEGQYPGYQLDSWGGTLGVDADVTPHLTVGLAVTAMYGDFSTTGPDRAEGDMDTYYLTLFARYARSAWTHTFVGTLGMADIGIERTVPYGSGSYTTHGDTDAVAFGLMYELGRVFVLNDERTACLQPVFNVMYRHAGVDAYTESGSNAALRVGDQSLDTVTFGVGARVQAEMGESLFNRKAIFESRALARFDVGDRRSSADVGFLHAAGHGTVESAEMGAFGVELGAGLTLPIGTDGALFLDASAEWRSGYTHFNGTLGYRINF